MTIADTDTVLAPIKEDERSQRMVMRHSNGTRDRTNAAAAALTKLRDDNLNPALQTIYDEAARRAQAESDYYDGVYNAMLGDNTNLNVNADGDPDHG